MSLRHFLTCFSLHMYLSTVFHDTDKKELFNTSHPSIYSWYLTGILPWKQGKFEIKANTLAFLIFQ